MIDFIFSIGTVFYLISPSWALTSTDCPLLARDGASVSLCDPANLMLLIGISWASFIAINTILYFFIVNHVLESIVKSSMYRKEY